MDNNPLKLYVNPAWRRKLYHTPLLFPFWGNPIAETLVLLRSLFNRRGFDTKYYTLTENISESDMVLLPYGYNTALKYAPELIGLCSGEAKNAGKPLLIDGMGDIEDKINIPNSVILRYGGYRFNKRENEIQLPPYAEDLLELYYNGEIQLKKKSSKPVVGFSGWASMTPKQELRTLVKEIPVRIRGIFSSKYKACSKGIFFRRKAIRILLGSGLIKPNFIIRNSFSQHQHTASGDPEVLRKEMVSNLIESDYGLDIRGDANASTRLCEILSLGRIPVILDTERNFPLENIVRYEDFSLKVDFRDLKKLPEIIAEFHNSVSEEKFKDMQIKARSAFRDHLRVDMITVHMVDECRKIIRGMGKIN